MQRSEDMSWGLVLITAFYVVGVVAVAFALFLNRDATGAQLASVHGLPWLPAIPAIALTLVMGVLVILALNSRRPWGFWLIMGYMAFLLLVPPYTLGSSHISSFANVFWPLVMVVYVFFKRWTFGVGGAPNKRMQLTE